VSGFVFFFSSSVTSLLNANLTENTLIMLSYLWGPLLWGSRAVLNYQENEAKGIVPCTVSFSQLADEYMHC